MSRVRFRKLQIDFRRRRVRRIGRLERLESRIALAADVEASPFGSASQEWIRVASASSEGEAAMVAVRGADVRRNPITPFDVNDDGLITPLDALIILNRIGAAQSSGSPVGSQVDFLDVNSDGEVTPLDALVVLNRLREANRITLNNETSDTGLPLNQSTLSVSSLHSIASVDPIRIRLTGIAINPANGALVTVAIPILSAAPATGDASQVLIRTAAFVPIDAQLSIESGALVPVDGTELPPRSAVIQQGLTREEFTLAVRPFAPTDIDLFTILAYPESSRPQVPSIQGRDESLIRSELEQHFQRASAAGMISPADAATLLDQFDSEHAKSIIPHPAIRAALFCLAGTVANAAIETVLTGANASGRPYVSIDFDYDLVISIGGVANAHSNGGRIVRFGGDLEGESIQALASLLVHELMHQDGDGGLDGLNGQQEEILADVAGTFTWAQFLLLNPALVSDNYAQARRWNEQVLALLNSGTRAFPHVGVTSSPQWLTNVEDRLPMIFPGGRESAISFDNTNRAIAFLVGVHDIDTPGNAFLNDVVARITQTAPAEYDFTRATRDLIDAQQQIITPATAIELAAILKLQLHPSLL